MADDRDPLVNALLRKYNVPEQQAWGGLKSYVPETWRNNVEAARVGIRDSIPPAVWLALMALRSPAGAGIGRDAVMARSLMRRYPNEGDPMIMPHDPGIRPAGNPSPVAGPRTSTANWNEPEGGYPQVPFGEETPPHFQRALDFLDFVERNQNNKPNWPVIPGGKKD